MMFLGGPEIVRVTGPSVEALVLPWLASLDSGTDEAFCRQLGSEDAAALAALADTLGRAGLLTAGGPPPPAAQGATKAFLDRFGALASIGYGAPGGALALHCPEELRSPLSQCLAAAGLALADPVGAPPDRTQPLASFEVASDGMTVSARLVAGAPREPLLVHVSIERTGAVAPAELRSAAALVGHWTIVAAAGLPTIDRAYIGGTMRALAPRRRSLPSLRDREGAALRAVWSAPVAQHPVLAEICRFAVGNSDEAFRRIAPSAGGLGATQAICLTRHEAQADSVSVWAFDPLRGALDEFAVVRRAAAEAVQGPLKRDAYVLLVSSSAELAASYGGVARRLARHDAGVAIDHAAAAAHALGCRGIAVEAVSPNAILQALGLAGADPRLFACALVGVNGATDAALPSRRSQPDALRTMLSRRSTRRFASTVPESSLIESLERAALRRLQIRGRVRDRSRPALYRLLRTGPDRFTLREIKVAGRGPRRPGADLLSGGLTPSDFIRQGDLREAPLIYLLGYPHAEAARQDLSASLPDRWVDEGEGCSAVWVEAHRHGLAGTLFGRVDSSTLAGASPGIAWAEICLCLGYAREHPEIGQ